MCRCVESLLRTIQYPHCSLRECTFGSSALALLQGLNSLQPCGPFTAAVIQDRRWCSRKTQTAASSSCGCMAEHRTVVAQVMSLSCVATALSPWIGAFLTAAGYDSPSKGTLKLHRFRNSEFSVDSINALCCVTAWVSHSAAVTMLCDEPSTLTTLRCCLLWTVYPQRRPL